MAYSRPRVLIFGMMPPPMGGVTRFITNLAEAANKSQKCEIVISTWGKICFRRYDAAHVNAYNPVKRLLQLLIGRLIAHKVYFTIHGGVFNQDNIFNRLSLWVSSGVFCLNEKIQQELNGTNVRSFLHTTIFFENASDFPAWERQDRSTKKLLFYINNAGSVDGKEIYGASFLRGVLDLLPAHQSISLTIVDLSAQYGALFDGLDNVEYIDYPVDFREYLMDADVYVRPTSTDGMSVALLEAAIMGVPCLASDVVERPGAVVTYAYGSKEDFLEKLSVLLHRKDLGRSTPPLTRVDDYLGFMLTGDRTEQTFV